MKQDCEILSGCELLKEVPAGFSIRQLTGDASTRSYFRIQTPSGGTVVLMKMPEPFDENAFPYLANYHLFRALGIPLAEIYHLQPDRGLVFLQDLGDSTYHELYSQWDSKTSLHYYLRALDAMRQIERGNPPGNLAFDTEKLSWELRFFQEHFLQGLCGITFSETESSELQEHFLQLAEELSERPRVLCHRDFHSRNLMVKDETVYILDFQDARLGPVTYDLASLVYDSYIQHPPEFIAHLERLFFTYHPDAQIQRYEYPRMCLQRNLKALGTFGYQASKLGKTFYVEFVAPTLSYVRKHFEKLPDYAEMRILLARHLPELA